MKQTLLSGFQLQRYIKPVKAMKCNDDELVSVDMIKDPLEVMVFTKSAEALRFRATDISLYGTNAGGVKSINLKTGDEVVSVIYCNKNDDFLLATNRNTIKRMKVTEVLLTKRSRSGNPVIKKLKSNPYLIVDAKKMTPNQYKENVKISLDYKNGSEDIDAQILKYNVSDGGKAITPTNPLLTDFVQMRLPEPSKPDAAVSPEYLVEVKSDLFSEDFGIEEEAPIVTSKKDSNQGIFDELDAILAKENGTALDDSIDISEDKDKKEVKYKKISLFDDESN